MTQNGVQIYILGIHLTLNHRIKPNPEDGNKIFEFLHKTLGTQPDFKVLSESTISFDDHWKKVISSENFKEMLDSEITEQMIKNMIHLYYMGPA